MNTHFIAFINKHGIACASDTDMTLYALSKQEPVVIVVNPYSPIPWDSIINAYLRKGCSPLHDDFSDYARDFAEFLKTIDSQKKWANLTIDEANVIFLGFGKDDLFPSAIDAYVRHDKDTNMLQCQLYEECHINHEYSAGYFMLSEFEIMQPVLNGVGKSAMKSMIDKHTEGMKKYKERVAKTMKKTQCKTSIDDVQFDESEDFMRKLSEMTGYHQHQFSMAIDSFNIEDMVKVAETFIDANDQLEHLKAGGIGLPNSTKELAVITRTEGLTWIKHCLYGL